MFKSFISVAVLAAVAGTAGAAQLDVTTLGSGPGTYSVAKDADQAFAVNLAAGTYSFSVNLGTIGKKISLQDVWLSMGTNRQSNDANDLGQFITTTKTATGTIGSITLKNATTVYLDVNADKADKKSYAGTFTVTAVPEPESYALFLAGLGALGIVARRRQKQA